MSVTFNAIGIARFATSLIIVLATHGEVIAQDQKAGFFSVVNAVNLPTSTLVSVDGKPLRPDGLKPGKVTGGLGFATGAHRVDATNSNCKPSSVSLELSPSASPILISYMVETKTQAGEVVRELRLFPAQNAAATTTKSFFALYAGQTPSRTVSFNGHAFTLQPLQKISLGTASSVSVVENGQPVGNFAADTAGNYLVVLFDKGSGLGAVMADDIIFKRAGVR
ncbi:MAG: hypothetical protein QOH39_125 [Verrucomicrobiota bacterium]|jgi:hypothetical protein